MDRPATPEQHLWSSILDSVSSSRAIPSKNVILLGEPSSGKSTIAKALLQKSNTGKQRETAGMNGVNAGSLHDFALGYQWADVKDEAEEDTLARLSVYSVPSSSPAHLALLPHFVPPKTALPHSLVMIVLDWTRPSTFVEQLYTWLTWVEKWTQGDGSRELEVLREEGRERLQSHLQHYTEPSSNVETAPLPGGNTLTATLLPLGPGSFTHNTAGVPIMVVCAKADMIDNAQSGAGLGLSVMKAKGGEWEERTDSIMQVLRTICLKYGAALFYTSSSQPISLTQLRAYALHFLFMPPAPPPDTPPSKYLFPFRQRPNLLDRDRIALPAGWDAWGSIGFVREGFDCSKWSEAWERELDDGGKAEGGAKAMYSELVAAEDADKGLELPPLITTEPEQAFLAKHYETLSKERDPRHTFTKPSNTGEPSMAGVVGPLGPSTFSLPGVKGAMDNMEGGNLQTRLELLGGTTVPRRDTRTATASNPLPPTMNGTGRPILTTNISLAGANGNATGSNPNSPLPRASTATPKSQHDVLQTFFSDLLRARPGRTPAAMPGGVAASGPPLSVPPSQPSSQARTAGDGAETPPVLATTAADPAPPAPIAADDATADEEP